MIIKRIIALLLPLAITACATAENQKAGSIGPASPQAAEGQAYSAPDAYTMGKMSMPAAASDAPAPPMKMEGMDSMEGMDMNMPVSKTLAETNSPDEKNGYYTCLMHPEVHEAKPGKCPQCGMPLQFHETGAHEGGTSQ